MNCPICLNKNISSYKDYTWTEAKQVFRLLACSNCDLKWTDPIPSDAILKSFYARSFNYNWYADFLRFKQIDSRERLNELRPFLGKSTVDYGGGFGYFASACSDQGIQSLVYDPYIPGGNKNISGKWDSVVALHSLEHSNDLVNTIEEFKRLLNQDGRVVISVPNSESSSYRTFDMYSVWAQPPFLHLFHFSKKNLAILMENNGFEIEHIYFFDRWDANYICDVLLGKLFQQLDGLWGQLKGKPLRKIYAALIGTLRRLGCKASNRNKDESRQELTIVCRLRSSPTQK